MKPTFPSRDFALKGHRTQPSFENHKKSKTFGNRALLRKGGVGRTLLGGPERASGLRFAELWVVLPGVRCRTPAVGGSNVSGAFASRNRAALIAGRGDVAFHLSWLEEAFLLPLVFLGCFARGSRCMPLVLPNLLPTFVSSSSVRSTGRTRRPFGLAPGMVSASLYASCFGAARFQGSEHRRGTCCGPA
jgi:hypothetical protein